MSRGNEDIKHGLLYVLSMLEGLYTTLASAGYSGSGPMNCVLPLHESGSLVRECVLVGSVVLGSCAWVLQLCYSGMLCTLTASTLLHR